jgi:hypothetical protein
MMIRPELPNLEDLSAAELRSLVVSLLEAVAQLEAKWCIRQMDQDC